MVRAHAGTLAVVPDCVATRRCALLHLAIGLNHINATVAFQGTIHEAVQPAQGQFPRFFEMCPSDCWPAVARCKTIEPLAVVGAVWQASRQLIAFQTRANDNWYVRLRPLAADRGRDIRCVQRPAFPKSCAPISGEKGTVQRQPPIPS